jgi:hypothetical protein
MRSAVTNLNSGFNFDSSALGSLCDSAPIFGLPKKKAGAKKRQVRESPGEIKEKGKTSHLFHPF